MPSLSERSLSRSAANLPSFIPVRSLVYVAAPVKLVYLLFLAAALVWIECFIGGTRLVYSIPAYALISVAAVLTLAGVRGRETPPDAFCLGSTLLLGGWILFRSSHSPVDYLALRDFYMMLGCLMVYLLTAFYFGGTREKVILVFVLGAIAALEVWCGFIQFFKDQQFMLFGQMRGGVSVNWRASGMFVNSNHFACFVATVAVVFLCFGIWGSQRIWVKLLIFYFAALCFFGVAISGSRGGYLAIVGSLVCFALGTLSIVRQGHTRGFVVATFGTLGLAILVGVAARLTLQSALLGSRIQSTSFWGDVRIYNWEAALDHFHLSPWIGTGAGTHLIYGRLFRSIHNQSDPVHAHCDYLELLAEYGVAGGFCMALFLIAHVRNGLRSFPRIRGRRHFHFDGLQSDRFAIQFGTLCAVAGLLIHSVVDFNMHIPGNALIFAFLFGVLANPGRERPLHLVDRSVTVWVRLLLPVLGVWMLWRAIPLLPSEYCSEMARRSLRANSYLDALVYAQKGLGEKGLPRLYTLNAGGWPSEETLDKMLRMLGRNPRNPELYYDLGQAQWAVAMGLKDQALSQYFLEQSANALEAELKIFPQDENALILSGQVHAKLERYPEAEEDYRKALALDPKLSLLYREYAGLLDAEGEKAEAECILQEHRELFGD